MQMNDALIMYSGLSVKPAQIQTDDVMVSAKVICNTCDLHITQASLFKSRNYYMIYSLNPGKTINAVGWSILGLEHDPIYGNICFVAKAKNGDITCLKADEAETIIHMIEDECSMWALKAANIHMRTYLDYTKSLISMQMAEEKINIMRIMENALHRNDCAEEFTWNDTCYLDCETTGLTSEDEILKISIINQDGIILLNEFVKPRKHKSWPKAEALHGITPTMVEHAPLSMDLILPMVIDIYKVTKKVVIYNAEFDANLFINFYSYEENLDEIDLIYSKTACCMKRFSRIYGNYSEYYNDYKHQSLSTAMDFFNLQWIGKEHDCLSDVFACKSVWEALENKVEYK